MRKAVPGGERESDEPDFSVATPALFHDLCIWQEQLARSVARSNIGLRSSGIALTVNRTVFRICLLAMATDRGLVSPDILEDIAATGESSGRLEMLFRKSGNPWTGTGEEEPGKHPVVDDSIVQKIAGRILSPDRAYRFSALSLEDLAGVLDRYCARAIRRSAAHQAVITDRPDANPVRDPALLDYVVTATLAASRSGRSAEELLPLRILDPSCGAGSLLIRAYHTLVSGTSTFAEKTEVLSQTLFGIDANPHSVAVTRLLLSLAVCEGEDAKSMPGDFFTVLGDLNGIVSSTIRCGNALIGPDIANEESWAFCPVHERRSIRPIDLHETFFEILAPGGFDAVISNPPDIPVPDREWLQRYFQRHYRVYDLGVQLSSLYFEQTLSLLRSRGTAGIVSSTGWLRTKAGTRLRTFLVSRQIEEILLPSKDDACFFRFSHTRPFHPVIVRTGLPVPDLVPGGFPVPQTDLSSGGWVFKDTRSDRVLSKIRMHGTRLEVSVIGGVRCVVPPERTRRNQIAFPLDVFPPRFRLTGRGTVRSTTGVIASGSPYLLGLLSSRLARFVFTESTRGTPKTGDCSRTVGEFPVYTPDLDDPSDRARQDRLEALVREMLDLKQHDRRARTEGEKHLIGREIESTQKQIDSLVFGIYDLSVEDIAVIDSALALAPV